MIIVHHLENSRSQRILWLLEELGLEYDVKRYERDARTNLAPATLKQLHPSGKSPLIEDGGRIFAETGAIVEYVLEKYGDGRLAPTGGGDDYYEFKYWMHAAEGSYMPPLVMSLFLNRMETAPMPFFARPIARKLTQGLRDAYLDQTIAGLFSHLDVALAKRDWLAGDFSGADIMMSFPAEAAASRLADALPFKNLKAYVDRFQARAAYQRALERGGPYAYA